MKLAIAMVSLSMAVVLVMVFQAVRQELDLRNLKSRMVQSTAEVRRKEEAIAQIKEKIQQLKSSLNSANAKMDQLKKKKAETVKSTEDMEKTLKTCTTEKEETEKKKTSITGDLNKLKADHGEAKKKAEQEIQGLKQQILDRDKAICTFADLSKMEAQKLCTFA